MFGLLSNKINAPNLSTQCFWELTTPNVVNILLCCAQIFVDLIRNADAYLLVVTKLGTNPDLRKLRQYPRSWPAKTDQFGILSKTHNLSSMRSKLVTSNSYANCAYRKCRSVCCTNTQINYFSINTYEDRRTIDCLNRLLRRSPERTRHDILYRYSRQRDFD